MYLLNDRTSNGAGTAHENYSYLQTIYCWGTFDGAVVTLEGSPDNNEWFTLTSFAEKGVRGIGVNARYLRGSVASAGASTSVDLLVS